MIHLFDDEGLGAMDVDGTLVEADHRSHVIEFSDDPIGTDLEDGEVFLAGGTQAHLCGRVLLTTQVPVPPFLAQSILLL